LGDLKVTLDDSNTRQRATTDTPKKSLEAIDGKINNNQQGQLENTAQGDINIEKNPL